MLINRIVLFITLVVVSSCDTLFSDDTNMTPNGVAKMILKAVATGEDKYFNGILLTEIDLKSIHSEKLTSSLNEMIARNSMDGLNGWHNESKREFNRTRKEGEKLEINWNDIDFEKFEHKELFNEKYQVNYLDGKIYFTSNGYKFYLRVSHIIKVENYYKGVELNDIVVVGNLK